VNALEDRWLRVPAAVDDGALTEAAKRLWINTAATLRDYQTKNGGR